MSWAILFAVAFVLLGGGIGLRPGALSKLGWVRLVGLGAGLCAVFAQLLPESAEDLGLLALAPFGVALVLSVVVELGLRPRVGGGATMSIDLGFLALLGHQVVEGFALGTLETTVTPKSTALLAMGSLTIHTVPIVAAFTLAIRSLASPAAAAGRVLILAVGGALGAWFSSSEAAQAAVGGAEGWVHAAVAGLLLHAVSHVAESHEHATSRVSPVARIGAVLFGLGLALPALMVHEPGHLFAPQSLIVVGIALAFSSLLLIFSHRAKGHHHEHASIPPVH